MRKPDNLVALHHQMTGSYAVEGAPPTVTNDLDWWALNLIEGQKARIAELEQSLKRQASAAKMGMDAAKKSGAAMYEHGKKMLAESNPEAIESERAANAVLTDRIAELEAALSGAEQKRQLSIRSARNQWLSQGGDLAREVAHENERLRECLKEARENLEDWGMYASEYFRDKHGIAEDLAAIDKVLGGGDE